MSDAVSAADDGASVAPVDNAAVEQTNDQAQVQDTTTEQVETPKDDKPRDDKGRFIPQARFNEVYREREEAKRERDYWRQQAEQVKTAQPSQSVTQGDKPPAIADFDYDLDRFTAAMTDYAVRQAEARAESKITTKAQQERQQAQQRTYAERAAKYAAENPDFDKSIDELGRAIRFVPEVVEAIAESEHGPAVAHYLAQHLDVADEVSRLPPHLAALKIGRIEAQVSAPKPKPVTNAPSPPPTVGGGAKAPPKDIYRIEDDGEWYAAHKAQLRKQR